MVLLSRDRYVCFLSGVNRLLVIWSWYRIKIFLSCERLEMFLSAQGKLSNCVPLLLCTTWLLLLRILILSEQSLHLSKNVLIHHLHILLALVATAGVPLIHGDTLTQHWTVQAVHVPPPPLLVRRCIV